MITKITDIDESTDEGKMLITALTELTGIKPYCKKDLNELTAFFWKKTEQIFPEVNIQHGEIPVHEV